MSTPTVHLNSRGWRCAQPLPEGRGGERRTGRSGRLLGLCSGRADSSGGLWKSVASRQVFGFVGDDSFFVVGFGNDSLSICAFPRTCVLSVCLCTYLYLYKAVWPSFQRRMSPQVGRPGSSCPFHHLRVSVMSEGAGKSGWILRLFQNNRASAVPPAPLSAGPASRWGTGGFGLGTPGCPVQSFWPRETFLL